MPVCLPVYHDPTVAMSQYLCYLTPPPPQGQKSGPFPNFY